MALQGSLKTIVLDHSYDLGFSWGCCVATLACHRIHHGSSLQKLGMRKKCEIAIVWSVSFFSFEMLGGGVSRKLFLLQLKINKSISLEDLGISTSEGNRNFHNSQEILRAIFERLLVELVATEIGTF